MARTTKFWLPISLACVMLAGCGSEAEYRKGLSPMERCMQSVKYDDRNAAAVKECNQAVKNGAFS